MAMIHYLYVGHFIRQDGFVRFDNGQIVTMCPIDLRNVNRLLKNYVGEGATLESLPMAWGMSIEPNYIVCFASSPHCALEFAADYAADTGAIIVDMGGFKLMTPEQLRQWPQISAIDAKTGGDRSRIAEPSFGIPGHKVTEC